MRSTRSWPTRSALLLLSLTAAACAAAPTDAVPDPEATAEKRVQADAEALVMAASADWTTSIATAAAHGNALSEPLVTAVDRNRAGAGAPAAVALLGRVGTRDAEPFLLGLVSDRGDLALEAALALGHLAAGDPGARRTALLAVAADRFADPGLRTAAACSALRLGARAEVADLLVGVVLAGTPPGLELQQRLGLPLRPRWAYERYLIQRALRDVNPDLPSFDTDAPWADLEAAADRIDSWLKSGPK